MKLYIYKSEISMILLGVFNENEQQALHVLHDYCDVNFYLNPRLISKNDWKNSFELIANRNLKNYDMFNINKNVFKDYFNLDTTNYYKAVLPIKETCISSLKSKINENEKSLRLNTFKDIKTDKLMIQNNLKKIRNLLEINDIENLNNQIWQFKNKRYYPTTNKQIKNVIHSLNVFIEIYNNLTTDLSNNLLKLVSELQIDQSFKNTSTIDSLTSIASEIRTKNYTDYYFLELLLKKAKDLFNQEKLLTNLNLEHAINESIKTTKLINKLTKD